MVGIEPRADRLIRLGKKKKTCILTKKKKNVWWEQIIVYFRDGLKQSEIARKLKCRRGLVSYNVLKMEKTQNHWWFAKIWKKKISQNQTEYQESEKNNWEETMLIYSNHCYKSWHLFVVACTLFWKII